MVVVTVFQAYTEPLETVMPFKYIENLLPETGGDW